MSVKSSTTHYGTVAIIIHWLSALLILMLIGSGFRATSMVDLVAKTTMLKLHLPLGIAILLLTIGRMGWWMFVDRKPVSLPMPRWQDRASSTVHLLFYVVIFGMAASGIGMMVLSGAGPIVFGGDAASLPNFDDYLPRTPHGIGARFILLLFVMHVGAALYHHIFKKDGIINRMW
jgi:cytochrome b561